MVICQLKLFDRRGVTHEAGYVYSVWSTYNDFPFGYLHLSISNYLECPLC